LNIKKKKDEPNRWRGEEKKKKVSETPLRLRDRAQLCAKNDKKGCSSLMQILLNGSFLQNEQFVR